MRAVGEELWEIEQLFQVKDWEDSEDAHPLQLKKKNMGGWTPFVA